MGDQRSLFDAAPMGRGVRRSAVLSPCGTYRYSLTRTWDDDLHPTAFVMLNPSTADADVDDPTIRRCVVFARAWGAGGIVVVNLYAYRATDPRELVAARAAGRDVRGPDRGIHLRAAFAVADSVVCAWGAHPSVLAVNLREILDLVPYGVEVTCLGRTKSGAPRHPLYLAATTPREPWPCGDVPRG